MAVLNLIEGTMDHLVIKLSFEVVVCRRRNLKFLTSVDSK